MKIIGIGRNYVEHAHELGNETPSEPIVFLMPDTALLRNNESFYIPEFTKSVHYELELVIKIAKVGKCVDQKFAHRYYKEIALGIDFTARDLQDKFKSLGLPWALAKGFDNSAAISNYFITDNFDINNLRYKLLLNDKIVQETNSNLMIFSVDKIISYVSHFMTLKIGDLIYTGTPKGVGEVKIGDNLKAYLNDNLVMNFNIK